MSKTIKEMNKEEYTEYRVNSGVEKDKAMEIINRSENIAKEMGMSAAETLEYIKEAFSQAMVREKYKKGSSLETGDFYGVMVSQNMTDYSAKWNYDNQLKGAKKDKEGAIQAGLVKEVDGKLVPIWNAPGTWKHGKEITPEKDLRNELVGIGISADDFDSNKGKSESEKIKYKKLKMSMFNNSKNIDVPTFSLVKFNASIGKNTSDNELSLFGNDNTRFEIIKEFSKEEVKSFVEEYYKGNVIDIANIPEFGVEHDKDYSENGLAFIFAGLLDLKILDKENRSNIIEIYDPVDDEIAPITCWTDKKIKCDFSENATSILITGTVKNDGDTSVINTRGLWVDKKFRVSEQQESIAKSLMEEPKKETEDKEQPQDELSQI